MPPQQKQDFLQQLDFQLPTDYAAHVLTTSTLHGEAGAYLVDASELHQYNADYEAAELFPGYFLIGSNGGGEAIAIEKATGYFVLTPFTGHDEETPIIAGKTWAEFYHRFQAGTLFDSD